MGRELTRFGFVIDRSRMIDESRKLIRRLQVGLPDVRIPVKLLSGGQRQAVAVARSVVRGEARVVIMDEPTAALGVREAATVQELIRALRDEGRSVLLISHNIESVFGLADRVVVLRLGRRVADLKIADTTHEDVVSFIVRGRSERPNDNYGLESRSGPGPGSLAALLLVGTVEHPGVGDNRGCCHPFRRLLHLRYKLLYPFEHHFDGQGQQLHVHRWRRLTFLFIAAEIDLSIGANLSFAGIIMAICIVNYNINSWLAALVAILASALVGAVNGFIVTVFGVQSFIVTLGMLSVLGGAALVITDGVPITYPTNCGPVCFPSRTACSTASGASALGWRRPRHGGFPPSLYKVRLPRLRRGGQHRGGARDGYPGEADECSVSS